MSLKLVKDKIPAEFYSGPHKQMQFTLCNEEKLNNPLLNNLYKDNICYTERWYLEARKIIFDENWDHPIIQIICEDTNLKARLIKSTVIDGVLMRNVVNNISLPEFRISAGINLKKLHRWCGFFSSLPDSTKTLVDLNDQC
ncbi:hypothetical protein N9V27_00080 [bacterium]|nr:hypothetical protein [bacterium]|tara:strand:+ start:476 stop:898 length:423 start_codon:yes stop_codon:yes gene_type:complete